MSRSAGPHGARGHGVHPARSRDVARGAAPAADGLLLVDKPAGMTSHDVVARIRRMAATRKVGHAGTLDPMATGLLIVGVGRATRFLTHLVGADKSYEATVRLGQETLTEDAEGEITARRGCPDPATAAGGPRAFEAALREALAAHTGRIMQVPSAVSAIKVDGVRSYARVRRGDDVDLPARAVTIEELRLCSPPRPTAAADGTAVVDIDLEVTCSSGTYVRAIARDLGAALGCGAHLTALRRTRVGPFLVDEARELTDLSGQVEADAAAPRPRGLATVPMAAAARRCFPAVELTEAQARAVGNGQFLPHGVLETAALPADGPVAGDGRARGVTAAIAPDGSLVALLARTGARARPILVVAPTPPPDHREPANRGEAHE